MKVFDMIVLNSSARRHNLLNTTISILCTRWRFEGMSFINTQQKKTLKHYYPCLKFFIKDRARGEGGGVTKQVLIEDILYAVK